MRGLDFSLDYPMQMTLVICALFPFILLLITKLSKYSGRNAFQFLLSFLTMTFGWIIAVFFIAITIDEISWSSIVVSFSLYLATMLIYLEIWALLSRGYTLGLLLTFYKANKPLTANELASLYRGGEGLDWLIKHRFSDLTSAKLIKINGSQVTLTAKGTVIAFLYKLSVIFFGLRCSG